MNKEEGDLFTLKIPTVFAVSFEKIKKLGFKNKFEIFKPSAVFEKKKSQKAKGRNSPTKLHIV